MTLDLEALLDAKALLTSRTCPWDLFISGYNDTERVQAIFESVPARRRSWWVIPEYGYTKQEVEHLADAALLARGTEAQIVRAGLNASGFDPAVDRKLCVDITGLMRPHILYLMAYLKAIDVREFDLLYTEPEQYSRREETRFAIGEDVDVRSVAGCIGAHENDTSGDVLVLGVGYDHHLISHVLQAKESARIVQLHSFPSLSADMYHESILRLDRVRSERPRIGDEVYYSSANDPFVVASSLKSALTSVHAHKPITNVYLSPLATKAQAVGFGLFYLRHLVGSAASIIYPNSTNYDRETSTGVGRSWIYPIVL